MALRTAIRLAGVAAASIILASCGVGQPGTSPTDLATPETSASPAASAGVASPAPADCPNFVDVVETGPMPGDDGTEFGPVAREQQRIREDVDAAIAYGTAHADEFASVRFENGPRVRMVIGFTAHIEEHCAALRAIVEYPDEFEMILQPETDQRLAEIQLEIVALAGDRLRGVGIGAGTIDVQLRADGEAIADRIAATYGDLVSIQVGMLPYPDRFAGDPDCGSGLSIALGTDLVAVATLDLDTVRSGEDFRGSVNVRNSGTVAFDFQSGPTQTAVVYELGATTPSGFFTGGLDSMGFGARLAPGESVDLEVIGGTASCDPAVGYALPPGAYEVRVPVLQLTLHDSAPTEVSYILSGPVPLTIVP